MNKQTLLFLASTLFGSPACESRAPVTTGSNQPGDTIIEVEAGARDACSQALDACNARVTGRIDPCNTGQGRLAEAECLGTQSACIVSAADRLEECVDTATDCYEGVNATQRECSDQCSENGANDRYECDEAEGEAAAACNAAAEGVNRRCEERYNRTFTDCNAPAEQALVDCNSAVQQHNIVCEQVARDANVSCREGCNNTGGGEICWNACAAELGLDENDCVSAANSSYADCGSDAMAGQNACNAAASEARTDCHASNDDPGCWGSANLARNLCHLDVEQGMDACFRGCYPADNPDPCNSQACYETSEQEKRACDAAKEECVAGGVAAGIGVCDSQAEEGFAECDAAFVTCEEDAAQ